MSMTVKPESWKIPLLGALLTGLLALAAGQLDLSQRLENLLIDWNLRGLAARQAPDPDIVLLDIDEPTLEAMVPEYGRYPWTRAVYGALLEGLARQKPRAIVFDILFTDPHKEHVADDVYFIKTAQRLPNVYFPMVRLNAGVETAQQGYPLKDLKGAQATPQAELTARAALLLPLPGLADTGRMGAINIVADPDGVIRRYPLYLESGGWRIPSLPARVASDLGFTVPTDTASLPLIWHGQRGAYHTVPFHSVYFDLDRRRPQRPAYEFAGKIVIIGTTASGLHDLKLTPVGADYPGPEIIATALDNLKNGERLHEVPVRLAAPLLATLAVLLLALAFARGVSVLSMAIGWLAASVLLVIVAWAALIHFRLALPVVTALAFGWLYYLAAALRAWRLERRQRQRVTQLFSRFLDPRIVTGLVEKGETDASLSGQKRAVTVLFSDIRGFTTLSEQKSPQEIVDLLNRYFSLQVEVIFRHQGTLDKYIGDAIMAFWGAPTDQPDHATRALACARAMEQTLVRFKAEAGPDGKDFDIGIGLHSGVAVVGFIGSPAHRQDYTVIGDTVNTASRIEGATKGRARILVSETTMQAAGDAAPRFIDHGFAKLKGRAEEVHLYEPKWD
jgi:adenylate cyclase